MKKSYKAIAVNSKLEMDINTRIWNEKLDVKEVKIGNEAIYDCEINKYPDAAKLKIIGNKFCLALEGKSLEKFKAIANIKNNMKYANVVIVAEELKRDFIEIPKAIAKEEERQYRELNKQLEEKLKANPTIRLERDSHDIMIRDEFEDSSEVKRIIKKIQSTFDINLMNFENFMVSEIKTDLCFSETYEIPFLELKRIEKIADKILKNRELEKENRIKERNNKKKVHFEQMKKKAEETGLPQVLEITSEFVDRGDSDIDNIVTYVYPDGSIREERGATY